MAHETLEAVRQIEAEAAAIQKNYEDQLERDRLDQQRHLSLQEEKFETQLQKELTFIEKDLEVEKVKAQERLDATIQKYQHKSEQALNQKRSEFVDDIVNEVTHRFTTK